MHRRQLNLENWWELHGPCLVITAKFRYGLIFFEFNRTSNVCLMMYQQWQTEILKGKKVSGKVSAAIQI